MTNPDPEMKKQFDMLTRRKLNCPDISQEIFEDIPKPQEGDDSCRYQLLEELDGKHVWGVISLFPEQEWAQNLNNIRWKVMVEFVVYMESLYEAIYKTTSTDIAEEERHEKVRQTLAKKEDSNVDDLFLTDALVNFTEKVIKAKTGTSELNLDEKFFKTNQENKLITKEDSKIVSLNCSMKVTSDIDITFLASEHIAEKYLEQLGYAVFGIQTTGGAKPDELAVEANTGFRNLEQLLARNNLESTENTRFGNVPMLVDRYRNDLPTTVNQPKTDGSPDARTQSAEDLGFDNDVQLMNYESDVFAFFTNAFDMEVFHNGNNFDVNNIKQEDLLNNHTDAFRRWDNYTSTKRDKIRRKLGSRSFLSRKDLEEDLEQKQLREKIWKTDGYYTLPAFLYVARGDSKDIDEKRTNVEVISDDPFMTMCVIAENIGFALEYVHEVDKFQHGFCPTIEQRVVKLEKYAKRITNALRSYKQRKNDNPVEDPFLTFIDKNRSYEDTVNAFAGTSQGFVKKFRAEVQRSGEMTGVNLLLNVLGREIKDRKIEHLYEAWIKLNTGMVDFMREQFDTMRQGGSSHNISAAFMGMMVVFASVIAGSLQG